MLRGRAAPAHEDLPYDVFAEALRALHAAPAHDPASEDPLAHDRGIARAALTGAIPEQRSGGDERHAIWRGVRSLLEQAAAGAPVVLILDDVHWADRASAGLLAYLLRRPPAAAGLLAPAWRDADEHAPARREVGRAGRSQPLEEADAGVRVARGEVGRAERAALLAGVGARAVQRLLERLAGGGERARHVAAEPRDGDLRGDRVREQPAAVDHPSQLDSRLRQRRRLGQLATLGHELLTEAELLRGDVGAARAAVEQARAHAAQRSGMTLTRMRALRAEARLRLAEDDADAAAALALESAELAAAAGAELDAARGRLLAGQALVAAGRREQAIEALTLAEECFARRGIGLLHRTAVAAAIGVASTSAGAPADERTSASSSQGPRA